MDLQYLVDNYSWALQIVLWVGAFKLFFTPTVHWIKKIIAATSTKKDDEILEYVEKSWAFKTFLWWLDYLTSIKIGGK